jgi:hypothetical protein
LRQALQELERGGIVRVARGDERDESGAAPLFQLGETAFDASDTVGLRAQLAPRVLALK